MTEALAPYCMINDNRIQLLLILNLVGISYAILMNGANILERTKCFFYHESKKQPHNDRTHITQMCNLAMDYQSVFYAAIVFTAILCSNYHNVPEKEIIKVATTAAAMFTGFAIIKRGIHNIVNGILFSKSTADEWDSFYSFTLRLLGFLLTPAALSILFFPQVSLKYVEFYSILILIAYLYTIINGLNKIIFAKKCIYVDIFLYLCALEFLPCAIVWKTMLQLDDFITIKI